MNSPHWKGIGYRSAESLESAHELCGLLEAKLRDERTKSRIKQVIPGLSRFERCSFLDIDLDGFVGQ
jgi:hypothetical protein